MKQGDKVLIEATVDAFMEGYKEKHYRVKIGETVVWVTENDIQKNGDGE